MNSVESTTIYISKDEQSVIEDLIIILNSMSMPLSDDDYVNIFRAIADRDTQPDDIDNMLISYE